MNKLVTYAVVMMLACCLMSACGIGVVLLWNSGGEVQIPKGAEGIQVPKGVAEGLSLNPGGNTDGTFEKYARESGKAVFAAFVKSKGCPECDRMKPVEEGLAVIYGDRIQFLSVDILTDDGALLAKEYQKRYGQELPAKMLTPTYIVFSATGEKVGIHIGQTEILEGEQYPDPTPLKVLLDQALAASQGE